MNVWDPRGTYFDVVWGAFKLFMNIKWLITLWTGLVLVKSDWIIKPGEIYEGYSKWNAYNSFPQKDTGNKPGLVGRVFANDSGDRDSIPGRVIPKTLEMVLDTSLLNTQQYKVRIKGKMEQSWERSSALSYT